MLIHTVDGSELPKNLLGCKDLVNNGTKLAPSTGAGFLPSTVFPVFFLAQYSFPRMLTQEKPYFCR